MAIFKKDLENINELNKKNRKIHTRSELLQFINLQNEASGYDFVDFKFELAVNFKKRFDQHKKNFMNISNKTINTNTFSDFINLFSNFSNKNINVFSNLERLIYATKVESNLFEQDLKNVSSNIKNSKKNRFDLIHSFLLNTLPDKITDDSVLLDNNTSSLFCVSKNLQNLQIKDDGVTNKKLVNFYKKIVKDPVKFIQIYSGFNFLKIDNASLIKNHNKPLSLMILANSINNIIENSFDYASSNSLFKGIYTENELNSKLNAIDFTTTPIIESSITKEILPIKYVDKFETINNTELKQLIRNFNSGLENNKNLKKASNEAISEDIFKFENFLCSENNTSQFNFTLKQHTNNSDVEAEIDSNTILPARKLLEVLTTQDKNELISIGHKTRLNYLESLTLIANHVNSNQLKLIYGVVTKDSTGILNYDNIKVRQVINNDKKGILNYKFEDIEDFTASIIKTRLICNNIVKKFKKYSINKGYDSSSINPNNKINYFLDKNEESRKNIETDINALTLNDSIIQINNSTVSISNFIESFNIQDNIFEIFNKKNNKINRDLIIINNNLLGEMNADDFISSNPDYSNIKNLNNQINDTINLNDVEGSMNSVRTKVKEFTDSYYSSTNPVFLNSATFFQEIKNICSNNLQWHLNKKTNSSFSNDRADILNNASILWLFNDSCKEMSKQGKEVFQNNFVNLLISYLYISTNNINSLHSSYNLNAENVILNQGPSSATMTELAPFFSFFSSDKQTPLSFFSSESNNKAVQSRASINRAKNEYYNVTPNVFETNGKSTHFLSALAQQLDAGTNTSLNSGHKLAGEYNLGQVNNFNVFNENKKNIYLTGYNIYREYNVNNSNRDIQGEYEDKPYCFIPQLIFKKREVLNKTSFQYLIYNSAMVEFYSNLANINSLNLVDVINKLFFDSSNKHEYIRQLSYSFETKNSFLNLFNFGNPYNIDVENDALTNNIFYQIANLFKTLISSLGLNQNNFSNLISRLNDNSNKNISDLKFMIKNTLKIASSIYCKMFNNLQSYTNLSDRIAESNYFYENSFDNQKILTGIATGATNNRNLKKYSKDMWQYYSNIFLDESNLHTNFTVNDLKKYRSFADKKFIYFLNEILGIQKNEIEILMEKILSFNLNDNNQIFNQPAIEQHSNSNNLCTRQKRVFEFFNPIDFRGSTIGYKNSALALVQNKTALYNDSGINTMLHASDLDTDDLNLIECFSNPFELFNLYDSTLFQLIPGLYNTSVNIPINEYCIELTPNLTIMNLFKLGNNSSRSYISLQRENSELKNGNIDARYSEKQISSFEFSNLTIALKNINLLTYNIYQGTDWATEYQNTNEIGFIHLPSLTGKSISRQITSNLIRASTVVNSTESQTYVTYSTEYSGDLEFSYGATQTTAEQQSTKQEVSKLGLEINNFTYDVNIYIKVIDFENKNFNYDPSTSIPIENKENYDISTKLNAYNVFSAIDNSFNLNDNYEIILTRNNDNNQISSNNLINRKSGLKESYSYENGFITLNNVTVIPEINLNLRRPGNQQMFTQKYVDINLNWYNHVMHGLITNDLGLAFSHDILLYYYDNFIKDIKRNYDKLLNLRNTEITINNFKLNVAKAKQNLQSFSNIDNSLFELSIDNVKLQKNYIKSLIKAKSFKNIVNLNVVQEVFANLNLNRFVEKIINLNGQNENGDFFMSYFDDFYIKDLWYTLNAKSELEFRNKINNNYQKINNVACVPNQSEKLIGSHILTVGINNDYKLDKNDIVLIKVEMTDHDFPEIIWEPKIFEYCAAFEDIENAFLQHKNAVKVKSIDDITNENPPIGITSYYSDFKLNEESIFINNNDKITLKDGLIQKTTESSNKIINGLNLSNNIGSINYTGDRSYLNPIIYQNKVDEILNILDLTNNDFIESKMPYDFKNKLTAEELKKVKEDLIKRCIHNQKINLRLKKISKLLNGFEPNAEFSLVNNKWMHDMFVLSDVYKIFIEDFQGNLDIIKELYPFTYEEISNAVKLNEYTYAGLNFHKLHLTTNHKLNIYLQFMSDFTKALLPDFINLTQHNFQKVYTFAVNPKDFIVTGLTGGNNVFIPNSSELDFQQIISSENVRNKILDEIGTETSLILRLTSDKTIELDDINYYYVINKKNKTRYIPKNVSYRISTIILE